MEPRSLGLSSSPALPVGREDGRPWKRGCKKCSLFQIGQPSLQNGVSPTPPPTDPTPY